MQNMIGLDIGGNGPSPPADELRPAPWYGMSPAEVAANGFVPDAAVQHQQQAHQQQQQQQAQLGSFLDSVWRQTTI